MAATLAHDPSSNYHEYLICRKRKHQKSGKVLDGFDVCVYCGTWFRYITTIEEQNIPEGQ